MKKDHSKKRDSFGLGIFPETSETSSPPPVQSDSDSSRRTPSGNPPATPLKQHLSKSGGSEKTSTPIGAVGKKGEPLCLAELLAMERVQGLVEPDYDEMYEKLKLNGDSTYWTDLQKMSMQELVAEARQQSLLGSDDPSLRHDLIFRLIKNRIKENGLMFGEGTLEILPDQFGFLRSPEYHYQSCPDDIYISPSQIRRFCLRKGCTVSGQIRPPKENERYFALLRVEAINFEDPNVLSNRPHFDSLFTIPSESRIILDSPEGGPESRIVDLIAPIGFGQRSLIVSPPRGGKSTLIQRLTRSALNNHPDLHVFVLMIDERPEDVDEMVRRVKGPHCEVACTTFDEVPERHVHVAEMVLEKSKRMVEYGKDVVIFLDSMTRLTKAFSAHSQIASKPMPPTGETGSFQAAKRYFSSARKVEGGGSLTIVATIFTDTESDSDNVIFDEFKGTGISEIWLERTLADKRIWPALNVQKSGTRREELLRSPEEYRKVSLLRRLLMDKSPADAIDFLNEQIRQTSNNSELLDRF